MQAAAVESEMPYRITTLNRAGLPLQIDSSGRRDVGELCRWIGEHGAWIDERMTRHGALLFRGFDIEQPPDFEQVARAIDPELKNKYLGTSPRDALTEYVFSASELPGYYPIPQHCEMSFTAHPPRRLFFCCLVPPASGSGETPLVDFRSVLRQLDPEVRQRFEAGGIRIVRNYSGNSGSRFDLWKLKRWDEMFNSTDRAAVEQQCRDEGFEPQWDAGDSLRLISTQEVTRRHPQSGEEVWHNHTQVFHQSAAAGEYKRIYRLRPSLRNWLLWQFGRVMVAANRRLRRPDEQAMHCTYRDGSEIPDADMEHLRDVIWQNMVRLPWRKGDVIAIDNFAVAHGRLPYRGPRQIAVCWA